MITLFLAVTFFATPLIGCYPCFAHQDTDIANYQAGKPGKNGNDVIFSSSFRSRPGGREISRKYLYINHEISPPYHARDVIENDDNNQLVIKNVIVNPAAPDTVPAKADTSHYGIVTVIQNHEGNPGKPGVNTTVLIGDNKQRGNIIDISWFNFDLGFNNYIDRSDYGSDEVNSFAPVKAGDQPVTAEQFSLRAGKSVNVNIWPVMATVNLTGHKLNLKTGVGIEMNNYRYSRNITYVADYSKTYVIRDSVDFKKNKLFTEYLTIPVLLNFESDPFHTSRSLFVSVGPTFGYLVKSRTKQVSSERHKEKNKDDFNLEKLRLGLRGELGFGPVILYGSYSFTPIHQYGLKQYPFSVGIILVSSHAW